MKNEPAMQAEQSDLEDFFENIMHSKPVRYAESGKEAPVRILYYIYYSYLIRYLPILTLSHGIFTR